MIILFFIAFLVMGGASISEASAAPWEDESEIPFSKLQVSLNVGLEKLLMSRPEEIKGQTVMDEYKCYSDAQKGVSLRIDKIFSKISEQGQNASSPMAITQTNVIWTGNPMPQHYVLRLFHMAEEKGRKLIVWGDSQNPPTHWEHRHDREAIKELKQFLSENENKKRLKIIFKVHANKELENFCKISSIFEKVDELAKKFETKDGLDDSQKDFARSFLTQIFFSATLGSEAPFHEEKKTAELSGSKALLNQFKIKVRSCFRFQKEKISQDLIRKFKTLQDAGKIEFRTLETLKTRSEAFFSKFLHQDLWDIINFERSDPSPNYAAVSDIARLIILCSGEANQAYEDLDALTLTPNVPLLVREQQIKIPAFVQNNNMELCGNNFLVSGKKCLQPKFSLIEIWRKYRFLKKNGLLDHKKAALKIYGTYWVSGYIPFAFTNRLAITNPFAVPGGYNVAPVKVEVLHTDPTIHLLKDTFVKDKVYMKLTFEEGNWK